MTRHIVFDLETLGNQYNAPVAQIGAIAFTEEGKVLKTFSRNIDLESMKDPKYNFQCSYSTIKWWLKQSERARKLVFDEEDAVDFNDAVKDFLEFVQKNENPNGLDIWSDVSFDRPILDNMIEQSIHKNTIDYHWHRDQRTLFALAGIDRKKEAEEFGHEAHVALEDCYFQMRIILKALKKLSMVRREATSELVSH